MVLIANGNTSTNQGNKHNLKTGLYETGLKIMDFILTKITNVTIFHHPGSSQCLYTEWMQLPILKTWPKSNKSVYHEECTDGGFT
jgi:hypothetical protein